MVLLYLCMPYRGALHTDSDVEVLIASSAEELMLKDLSTPNYRNTWCICWHDYRERHPSLSKVS